MTSLVQPHVWKVTKYTNFQGSPSQKVVRTPELMPKDLIHNKDKKQKEKKIKQNNQLKTKKDKKKVKAFVNDENVNSKKFTIFKFVAYIILIWFISSKLYTISKEFKIKDK